MRQVKCCVCAVRGELGAGGGDTKSVGMLIGKAWRWSLQLPKKARPVRAEGISDISSQTAIFSSKPNIEGFQQNDWRGRRAGGGDGFPEVDEDGSNEGKGGGRGEGSKTNDNEVGDEVVMVAIIATGP